MWISSGLLSSLALATLAAVQGAGASPTPPNFPVNPGAGLDVRMEPASDNDLYGRYAPMPGFRLPQGPQCAGTLEVCNGNKNQNLGSSIGLKRDADEKIPAGPPMPRTLAHIPACKSIGPCPAGNTTSSPFKFEIVKRELAAAIARAKPVASYRLNGKPKSCDGCKLEDPAATILSELVPKIG